MTKKICVVGGGLAGGILASKLAAAGHRVTLLEQGDDPAPLMPDDETWEGGGLKSTFTRGKGLGGSSNFWHGGLIAFDKSDVDGPSSIGATTKFPLSYAQLCDYYRAALQLMSGGEVRLEDLATSRGNDAPLRIDGDFFELKPLIFPSKPFSTKGLIEEAKARHGMEIVRFTAETLVFAERNRATAVEGFHHGEGRRAQIAADIIVICAGGIGSPKILLKAAASNPALRRLPIGRHLIDHPTGFVFKAKLKKRRNLKSLFGTAFGRSGHFRRRWGVRLKDAHLDLAQEHNHVLYLRPAFTMRNPHDYQTLKNKLVGHRGKRVTPLDVLQLFKYVDLLMEALNFKFGVFPSVRYVAGFVFAEQLPDEENAITLREDGGFTVHWAVSPRDNDSLQRFLTAFLERHPDLFEDYAFFPGLLDSGAHHSGACRMALSESEGVVDGNLRVFGVENLFVADGSVLPFGGHANTGLTIAALALKCFDAVHESVGT